ncbi:peptidase S33 family protein [Pleurotus pulmonarius]
MYSCRGSNTIEGSVATVACQKIVPSISCHQTSFSPLVLYQTAQYKTLKLSLESICTHDQLALALSPMTKETTGHAPFRVGQETYQTWYKVVGELGAGHRPIVCLHGGGGMTHHYMLPHIALNLRLGVPVVFYDQLGNGESTHLPDAPKDFWKPDLWVDELHNLLLHLGISDDFDLLGNSWGGMLAAHFATTQTNPGLKSLIVSNSPASIPLLKGATEALIDRYPDAAAKMRKHAEAGTFTDPEYRSAAQSIHAQHFCRAHPIPEDLMTSLASVSKDPTVFSTMVGPSVYHITGNIKTWSIIDKLDKISCPMLLISSPHDFVQPSAITPWFQGVPKVKWVELQNSTHMPMFEEPERYFDVLVAFLSRDDKSEGGRPS